MANEQQLSEVLSEFARTMVTDFPIQAILEHLVVRIVDVLPVSGAGVTLIAPHSDPRYVAASDGKALRFEELQSELGEGPCLVAYESGEAVSVADLGDDDRFPRFGPMALDAGLAAVFTFPLRQGEKRLGALDLYRTTPGPLDEKAMNAAQTLADVAAAYLANAQARTELAESSERYRESALHDALTGLPNRVLLGQRVDHAVLKARRSGRPVALLFADLDRFKEVNDVHGHQKGDELLVGVAERLRSVLRPGDTLARLSGDEFVVLCEDLDDRSQAEPVAARIAATLARPFLLSGSELQVTASVGIAFAGTGDDIPELLLRDADIAMYQAKRRGGGHHQVVDLREHRLSGRVSTLEQDLRGAAARGGELRVEYQPIVATADGRVTGVEALLRWGHPIRGTLPPATVVPLAEKAGLATGIGRWVLETALRDRNSWQRSRNCDLAVAVNVSAQQLMAPDFVPTVAAVLDDTDTDAALVSLEVTETAFVEDADRALVVLEGLKRIGVVLSLDDFGTGYSSFGYLERFPLDTVKIDRRVVGNLKKKPSSTVIAASVVEMARVLDMRVVAEGVETAEQHTAVGKLGCGYCQGYYFARPLTAERFGRLLASGAADGDLRLPPPAL